ncbi:hypothetical protein [Komagataeibacter europaeus]|uniref:hypothetical protein n=1 Tax=Komagataeibacter europaeus TaxID=33995 RepID=UPI0012FB84CD|nr:hypothetical protein [Komagataeibacter europaeus]
MTTVLGLLAACWQGDSGPAEADHMGMYSGNNDLMTLVKIFECRFFLKGGVLLKIFEKYSPRTFF